MKNSEKNINRRAFLKTTGKATASMAFAVSTFNTLSPSSADAAARNDDIGDYDFLLPRVKFESNGYARWDHYPGADTNLLNEFSKVVRCRTKPVHANNTLPNRGSINMFNAVVDLTDIEQLRKYPFLFMTTEGRCSLDRKRKQNLWQYLNEGGFILMDDCVLGDGVSGGDFFYQDSCVLMRELFGSDSVEQIPNNHEVFHNVYDFGDQGLPYIQGQKHPAHGVFIGGRLAVFLSATDLHCGWAGCFSSGDKRDPRYQMSIQMGINIIMYAISH